MSQIIGSSVSFLVEGKLYLLSYVSLGEWETFSDMLTQKEAKDDVALQYLLYCSLHRATPEWTEKQTKELIRQHPDSIMGIVDKICEFSLPKTPSKKEKKVPTQEKERSLKTAYRILSRMHGWTPQQISNLSPAQMVSYLAGGKEGTGIAKMSGAEYRSLLAARGMLGSN